MAATARVEPGAERQRVVLLGIVARGQLEVEDSPGRRGGTHRERADGVAEQNALVTMKMLHEGLGISRSDYAVLMHHAETTLDGLGVAKDARAGLLAFLGGLERETVEQP